MISFKWSKGTIGLKTLTVFLLERVCNVEAMAAVERKKEAAHKSDSYNSAHVALLLHKLAKSDTLPDPTQCWSKQLALRSRDPVATTLGPVLAIHHRRKVVTENRSSI